MGVKLFRIYDVKNKTMTYKEEASSLLANVLIPGGFLTATPEYFYMDSTGLRDAAQKLIYEDDIVKMPNGAFGAVEFINGSFGVTTSFEEDSLTFIRNDQVPWDKCRVVSDLFESIILIGADGELEEGGIKTPINIRNAIKILNAKNN